MHVDSEMLNGVVFVGLKKAFDTVDHAWYPRTKTRVLAM